MGKLAHTKFGKFIKLMQSSTIHLYYNEKAKSKFTVAIAKDRHLKLIFLLVGLDQNLLAMGG